MGRAALCTLFVVGIVFTGLREPQAAGEPAALTVAYGNGVHAYYASDFQRSYDELSQAIEAGSRDPRAYYFRGLAALKLGRLDEGEADFQQAASLEADGRGPVSSQAISRALERVQGGDRLKLEEYRGRARIAAVGRNREDTRRRYSGLDGVDLDALRQRRPERTEPAERVAVPEPRADAGDAEAPAAEAAEPAAEPSAAPPAAEPADTANPFADDPA